MPILRFKETLVGEYKNRVGHCFYMKKLVLPKGSCVESETRWIDDGHPCSTFYGRTTHEFRSKECTDYSKIAISELVIPFSDFQPQERVFNNIVLCVRTRFYGDVDIIIETNKEDYVRVLQEAKCQGNYDGVNKNEQMKQFEEHCRKLRKLEKR
jgi:hypothetical protein